jgi:hypothetical protein
MCCRERVSVAKAGLQDIYIARATLKVHPRFGPDGRRVFVVVDGEHVIGKAKTRARAEKTAKRAAIAKADRAAALRTRTTEAMSDG